MFAYIRATISFSGPVATYLRIIAAEEISLGSQMSKQQFRLGTLTGTINNQTAIVASTSVSTCGKANPIAGMTSAALRIIMCILCEYGTF